MADVNMTGNSTQTNISWTIDITDPWTITAIVLLGLLSTATLIRIYQTCIRSKNRTVKPSNRTAANSTLRGVVENSKKNIHHQTRAQMRT